MKSISVFAGTILVVIASAGCTSDPGESDPSERDPAASHPTASDPAASGTSDEKIGQTQQALTCGIYCTPVGICISGGSYSTYYRCVASACGYSYGECNGSHGGAGYCAFYGGC
jgi:hypothetical protein